jgi:hypothetical protein
MFALLRFARSNVMGVWGTSLYSGDFAMDLRGTIGAVLRLPFDVDKLVDILCEREPTAAMNPDDEDHTTFWIVLADQFAKRGVDSERARSKALAIIDAGEDIATLEKLGMKPADIRKRRKMLYEVRARILEKPGAPKQRATLKTPQPLVMETGDVLVYPTCGGRSINPYYASKELNVYYDKGGPRPWEQDGWAAMVVIDCGRAFGFLSWYRGVTLAYAQPRKPSIDNLRSEVLWRLGSPGTCSANHYKKMELEKIGVLPIDPEKLRQVFPDLRPGISAAVQDISIANSMNSAPNVPQSAIPKPGEPAKGRARTMMGIEQILQQ